MKSSRRLQMVGGHSQVVFEYKHKIKVLKVLLLLMNVVLDTKWISN